MVLLVLYLFVMRRDREPIEDHLEEPEARGRPPDSALRFGLRRSLSVKRLVHELLSGDSGFGWRRTHSSSSRYWAFSRRNGSKYRSNDERRSWSERTEHPSQQQTASEAREPDPHEKERRDPGNHRLPGATDFRGAIAASLERLTVYRHFPREEDLFRACVTLGWERFPPPDHRAWAKIGDPELRLRTTLTELYAYYDSVGNELLLIVRLAPHADPGDTKRALLREVGHHA